MPQLSTTHRDCAVALVFSGSSVRGVARFVGVAEKSLRRYIDQHPAKTEEERAAFVASLWPRIQREKAQIDARTEAGKRGELGGVPAGSHPMRGTSKYDR